MSYLNQHQFDLGADSQEDAAVSTESLRRKFRSIENRINDLNGEQAEERLRLQQQQTEILVELKQPERAWQLARPILDQYVQIQSWQKAVEVCNTLFRSGHDDALIALGQGLWLGITFPIDPSLTVVMLQHVIDETPEDSDGAAVAAAVAAYVADLRGSENQNDDITLAVGQMLNDVARRHGNVTNQDEFNAWFQKLELDDPGKFLVRMRLLFWIISGNPTKFIRILVLW